MTTKTATLKTAKTVTRTLDMEALDRAIELSMKLNAMLMTTYAENGDSFRSLNDSLQDAFMWACSDMADELKRAVQSLSEVEVTA